METEKNERRREKKDKMPRKPREAKYSIRSKIIATGVCPLVIMSTAVSLMALNGYNGIGLANVIALVLLIGVVQLLYVAHGIVKSVRKVEEYMSQLAEGNLNIAIDEKLNKRDDELGCMAQALTMLKSRLETSMGDIQNVSDKLMDSEENLAKVVDEVDNATKQIQIASKQIVSNADKQNGDMTEAANNIEEINSLISNIAISAEQLKNTSAKMQEDGRNSMQIMNELMESNEHTNEVINRINEQIHLTYDVAVKITDVTAMMDAIAKQTSLLALNASIEAARAGESGRGFAVVAEEIGNLASQSAESAKEINELITSLSTESEKMLEIVDEVNKNARAQKDNLEKTQVHFEKVNEGIKDSLREIFEIGKQAEVCDTEKNKVTKHIEELRILTEESARSIKDTEQMVETLGQTIADTELVAVLLKDYANTLDEHVSYFVTERR